MGDTERRHVRRIAALTAALSLATVVPATTTEALTGRCPQYEPMMVVYAPRGGWDVRRMSRYAYRESRCNPRIVNRTGRDTGLFQVHPVTWPYLSAKFNVPMRSMQAWLKIPANNVRAAAKLCEFGRRAFGDCYQPWRTH